MILLKNILKEIILENLVETSKPFHIVVVFDKSENDELGLITEGDWIPSCEKGYWQRIDTPKFDTQKTHIHIAKQKHINTKNKQVAWNDDGTRHDKKSFNQNFNGIEKAKKIAIKALGLSSDVVLENLEDKYNGQLLLESIDYLPAKSFIFIFQVVNSNRKNILLS